MAKKSLESVTADLSALAAAMPTQRPVAPPPAPELKVVRSAPQKKLAQEPLTQFSFSMRKSLRKELARLASDADMTMQAFILSALKDKGLAVTEEDLVDRRRER